jgi:hypothetical protein
MQVICLWLAAGASLATFAVHTFAGGIKVARPLLADRSLPLASKWLNYYCWHIVTLLLIFMSGAFAFAALDPQRPDVAVFASALAVPLCVLSVAVALRAGIPPLRFPSTTLFAIIAALGWAGIAAG